MEDVEVDGMEDVMIVQERKTRVESGVANAQHNEALHGRDVVRRDGRWCDGGGKML
jgi:hypothetical protein